MLDNEPASQPAQAERTAHSHTTFNVARLNEIDSGGFQKVQCTATARSGAHIGANIELQSYYAGLKKYAGVIITAGHAHIRNLFIYRGWAKAQDGANCGKNSTNRRSCSLSLSLSLFLPHPSKVINVGWY